MLKPRQLSPNKNIWHKLEHLGRVHGAPARAHPMTSHPTCLHMYDGQLRQRLASDFIPAVCWALLLRYIAKKQSIPLADCSITGGKWKLVGLYYILIILDLKDISGRVRHVLHRGLQYYLSLVCLLTIIIILLSDIRSFSRFCSSGIVFIYLL